MRYLALATDYDGTLAHDGRVDDKTVTALENLVASGRRLILVTGRELDDLQAVFPRLDLFDRVVAENGALLYRPATREEQPLSAPPPDRFAEELHRRGVEPVATGRVIVATWHPHETTVLEVIRDLGLELQVIFNKGAVMVLPAGVNKATGLGTALGELALSAHNVVGVGDAENDHAFLSSCECSVAVANALPMLKERCDVVTDGDHGAGVRELIEMLIHDDLQEAGSRLRRHDLLLGTADDGEVRFHPYGSNVLLAGPSGSGKSTLARAFLERLHENRYQVCVIDPEGDYASLAGALVLGDAARPPTIDEALQVLESPAQSVVLNLIGMDLDDRPRLFEAVLPRLQELRAKSGRPHWVMVDEAHHLMPASWRPASVTLPKGLDAVFLVTVHPDLVSTDVLSSVDTVLTVGDSPGETFRAFATAAGVDAPSGTPGTLEPGEYLMWERRKGPDVVRFRVVPPTGDRTRHRRKYAAGELAEDRSFYFRGPQGKLKLRAQNLMLFLQLADGVDDETWLHHLRQGDYSAWMRECIKDPELADEVLEVEQREGIGVDESRALVREAVEQRYTSPA